MPAGNPRQTYRDEHLREGKIVRGHPLRTYSPAGEAGLRNPRGSLSRIHTGELARRVARLNHLTPGKVAPARREARQWLDYINGLGDLSDAQYNHYMELIERPTVAEREERARLMPGRYMGQYRRSVI